MKTHAEYNGKVRSQRLADLQDKTAELERQLSDTRISLEQELAESARSAHSGAPVNYPDERTQRLLDYGRPSAPSSRFVAPEENGGRNRGRGRARRARGDGTWPTAAPPGRPA